MKGMELSKLYYEQICKPKIESEFYEYKDRIAVGLAGEGSECYRYDDELSQDHDFGPSCCFWLTNEDYLLFGHSLHELLETLPKTFMSFPALEVSEWGSGRRGVLNIDSFYMKFIGRKDVPVTINDWRRIPETALSAATNGLVFTDPLGEFSKIRNGLLGYYPEDIRLNKIAARCMKIAQSGQYNFARCVKRKEFVAARIAESEFINETISMIYLLNKKYKPFYKWMHKDMQNLEILGKYIHKKLNLLIDSEYKDKIEIIEKICESIITEMKIQGLTNSESNFLLDHGVIVQGKIKDADLRKNSPWLD